LSKDILLDITSVKNIYAAILAEVDDLLQSFNREPGEDEETEKAREEAQKQLKSSRQEIQTSLKQLEKNSEWDVFTMAFYGETNAGKSTLIETLRILLNEPEKKKERQEFDRLMGEYTPLRRAVEECRASIDRITNEYGDKFQQFDSKIQSIIEQTQNLSGEITSLTEEIKKLYDTAKNEKKMSVANFFRGLFGKLPAQIKAKELKKTVHVKEAETKKAERLQNELKQEQEKSNQELQNKISPLKAELDELNADIEPFSVQIESCIDGRIIGDGRSDFTRTVTSYSFEVNNQKFALLDLPGIEGNEGAVLDAINAAVQKAHVVFYVTDKPRPPQTGDENSEGTLEKIKKHLGQQTEVFTIYNKRVKNPKSLQEPLVAEDEEGGLRELDKIMGTHLGEQYCETLSVSAHPAFLAVANCWQNDFAAAREKFLEHFNSEETLLEKTRLQTFVTRLTTGMVNDCKVKIKKSNYKKAAGVLDFTIEGIRKIYKRFMDLQKDQIGLMESTGKQLDNAAERLKSRLDAENYNAIENFKRGLRQKIYNNIDDAEINDNEFKNVLENHIETSVKELQGDLEARFNGAIEEFKGDVQNIIKKYQKYAIELITVYAGTDKFNKNFELNINIKNDINLDDVLSSIIDTIRHLAEFENIFDWALAIAGVLIKVGKAAFFSNNTKSQEKKATNENIKKIEDRIFKEVNGNLTEAYESLCSGINDIKDELNKLINRIKETNEILAKTESKFAKLSAAIKAEGVR
jgi:hypothetical protein